MHIHRRLFRLAVDVPVFLPSLALISLILSAVIILQMYLLSSIIASVFIQNASPNPALLYLLAGTILARAILLWLRERVAQLNAIKIKSELRFKLFDDMLEKGPAFTRSEKTGDLVAIVAEGIEKLDDYFTRYIPSVIHLAILPPAIILFALFIDWPSGLIMALTGPLIVFFMWLIGTYAKRLTQKQWGQLSAMSAHFLDAVQGLKTLKVFGAESRENELVSHASNRFRIITMQVLKVAFLSGMVLELAASISIALVAVQVGIRLIEGLMVYQLGLFVLLMAPEFYIPFRMLGLHHHSGMEGAAAAEKIFSIIDSVNRKSTDGQLPLDSANNPTIIFRDVSFVYPRSEYPAINEISCSLEPGQIAAMVGSTGSGKTTFAFLLLGYLSPTSGQILVNDKKLDQIKKEDWQRMIAYVPQHPHFFNTSILENLLMAKPNASQDKVEHALDITGLSHLIQQLPQGLNTPLTENASRLSGGEKQRLALARAFLKDAPVLILDEPTSSLDPESEQLIADATKQLAQNRTTLIIAHRLKTVQNADRILVFEKGKIAETGNHESLFKQKGIYSGFFQSQGLNNSNSGQR